MSEAPRLIVEQGPDKGKEFAVPVEGGARAGRSSGNVIALKDPSVSRHHCRLFVKSGDGLWITDLGSANQTLVNGSPVREVRVRPGDRIAIGDTVLRVLTDGAVDAGPAPEPAATVIPEPETSASASTVDLGLAPQSRIAAKNGKKMRLTVLLVAVGLAALAAMVVLLLPRIGTKPDGTGKVPPKAPQLKPDQFHFRYEKVEGSTKNVFRFFLLLENGTASIQVDDLANGRHFEAPPTQIKEDVILALAQSLVSSRFFELEPMYTGRSRNVYELRDLTITADKKTHRTKVFNAAEPPEFEKLSRIIEEFGLTQFGIRALPRPREELITLARDSWLLGKKLYDERNVRYENLYAAAKAFKETDIYLETIDPKPDFFEEALTMKAKCDEDLEAVYQDLRFQAERAVKLKEWKEASDALQIILTSIPDRSDERHQQAERQLILVQQHLEK